MAYVIVLIIGLAASAVGTIIGIGGGVIIKPVMDAVLDMSVVQISFISGCTVLAMSAVSFARNVKQKERLDIKKSTVLAVGGAVGGVAGKAIFDIATKTMESSDIVGAVQSTIMVVMTAGVFIYTCFKDRIRSRNVKSPVVSFAIGGALGVMSAFLGIGGGPINIAILVYCFSMDSKTAAANSLYIILFSQLASLITTAVTGAIPEFSPAFLVLMMGGGAAGALIGGAVSGKLRSRHVDKVFLVLLAVIIAISIYNIFNFVALAS